MSSSMRPSRPSRCALVALLVTSLATACSVEKPVPRGRVELAQPAAAPGALNVLVVLVDTTRADHLHFMGYPRATTPHLDAFAARSVVFERHHSSSSRTEPSVASLFTGRYPGAHGVLNPLTHFDAKGRLGEAQVTMAERLSQAGYATYGVVTNVNASSRFGFGQGFDVYEYFPDRDHGRRVNERAFALLDAHDPQSGPFFMYLHYIGPHSPYVPEPRFRGQFTDASYDGPIDGSHGQLDEIVGGALHPNARDVAQLAGLYDEDLRTFDERFGELVAGLEERGLDERTVILFVADHGEELFDHGSVLHGYTLYEEQLHVPLVVRTPSTTAGARVAAMTRHVDILPFVLATLGLPPEPRAQGRADLLVPAPDRVDEVFAQVQLRAVKTVRLRSIEVDGWKLIEHELPTPRVELFHLAEDPRERADLSSREPARVASMTAVLHRLDGARSSGEPAVEDVVTLTDDELAQLRALGYVGDAADGGHAAPPPAERRADDAH